MRAQPGIINARHVVARFEELGDHLRVARVLAHSQRERLRASHRQPGVVRPRNAADGVLRKAYLLVQRVVVRDRNAADDVAVAADVLRRRVDGDLRAERERLLKVGRRKGVVHRDELFGSPQRGDRGDIDELEQRITGRFEPKELRRRPHCGAHRGEIGHVDVRERKAISLENPREEAVCSAVEVVADDDVIAGR